MKNSIICLAFGILLYACGSSEKKLELEYEGSCMECPAVRLDSILKANNKEEAFVDWDINIKEYKLTINYNSGQMTESDIIDILSQGGYDIHTDKVSKMGISAKDPCCEEDDLDDLLMPDEDDGDLDDMLMKELGADLLNDSILDVDLDDDLTIDLGDEDEDELDDLELEDDLDDLGDMDIKLD